MTGGFGFLGGHLVDLLTEDPDNHVHVVDNLSSNPIDHEQLLEEIGDPENISYSIASVQEWCAGKGPDVEPFDQVYHLASVVGPAGVLPHAGQMIKSIVDDTYALTDLSRTWDARFLDVSTSEVYGGGQEGYCSERLPKIVPADTTVRLEYSMGKLAAETALQNMATVSDLETVIVRPFNIAGPRQSKEGGFVLPRFLHQALNGKELTVFGDGSQVRAFTHVRDMAQGIVDVMHEGESGEAYNIGNPDNKTTILELAEKVVDVTDSSSEIAHVDPKEIYGELYEEANDKFPDASKAMKNLGWEPRYGIDRIIQDTVDWVERHGEVP